MGNIFSCSTLLFDVLRINGGDDYMSNDFLGNFNLFSSHRQTSVIIVCTHDLRNVHDGGCYVKGERGGDYVASIL